ncbi:MAG: hypothetical protein J6V20_00280 [Bacteroidaceae bacterium]|nr:hypothetical protein [Bacteroidaceae bacterium]
MALPMILSGINGALGLYSTVKGIVDSSKSKKQQSNLRRTMQNEEDAWYRRNYYGNFMDDKASKAAIKRVENTLRRNNEQERARGIITGSTPEISIARNEQGLRTMENVINNLAVADSNQDQNLDMMHRQNNLALKNAEMQQLSLDERMAKSAASNGYNLMQNALLGANWGKEKR